jgi:hypothetical protein
MIGKVLDLHFRLGADPDSLLLPAVLATLSPDVPHLRYTHDGYPQWMRPDELQDSTSFYEEESVLFLSRDPRDVIVSLYFEKARRLPLYQSEECTGVGVYGDRVVPYEGTLWEFFWEETGSLHTYITYLNQWATVSNHLSRFRRLRYEDVYVDPLRWLQMCMRFLGVEASEAHLAAAVTFGSFGNMQHMEESGCFRTYRMRSGSARDPESRKARRGIVGGFRDYLTPEHCDAITQYMRERLTPLYGYFPTDQSQYPRAPIATAA